MTPVEQAQADVLQKAREWLKAWRAEIDDGVLAPKTAKAEAQCELLAAIVLMVSREAENSEVEE